MPAKNVDGQVAILLNEGAVSSYGSTLRTAALAFCAIALTLNLIFMIRLDNRQEKFMDYGKFQGQYESERTEIQRQLMDLRSELATERAWKGSIKTDLGELLALMEDARMRNVVQRMIDKGR